MEFVALTDRTNDVELHSLLALALGDLSPQAAWAAANAYAHSSDRFLFGLVNDTQLVGVIGAQVEGRSAKILHIAVLPDRRLNGFGRRLIYELGRRLEIQELNAETDRDAVDFYKNLGFEIRSLGEVYPGVERFICGWRAE